MVFIILEGVFHAQMIESLANANARMVHMVHTMLGMMRCCTIPDVAMLRWIAYVKSLNLEV